MHKSEDLERRAKIAFEQPWWKNRDPVLLSMQEEEKADDTRHLMRWGMWFATIFNAGYVLSDVYLLPDVGAQLVFLRFSVMFIGVLGVEIGVRKGWQPYSLQLFAACDLLYAAFGFLFIALNSQYQSEMFAYSVFTSIFVLAVNLFFNFRFALSVVVSGLITAAYVFAFTYLIEGDVVARAINAAFFVMIFSLSLYLSWRLGLERYHTFINALQAQIQEKVAIEKGEQLKKIAETDPLTGLMNRRALGREFLDMSRHSLGSAQQVGVLLIDVDFFKNYNDSLGHTAGDECLIALAACFSETAEGFGGVAGRFGGEEFLVLCPVGDRTELANVASAFCKAVEERGINHPDRPDGRDVVTISVGATITENDGAMDMIPLLQQADRALYASKFSSRATYTVFDPEAADSDPSSLNLNELLRVAVERDLVSLHYQPIFDVKSGELKGHEALMRLSDFDGSPIHPPVFIPAAEQSGAIIELGKWAVERALTDLVAHDLGEYVSVNVSAVQIKMEEFPLHIADIINRLNIPAERLALEVTEGMDIYLETQAQRNIELLRKLGVKIWLDDFGTGFAGLAWLNRFNFDVIKIDRSFLNECQSPQGLSLFQDMVRMLRNQSFTVLVEGVETAEQRTLLKRLGVHSMQGFFLGKPAPVERIEEQRQAANS